MRIAAVGQLNFDDLAAQVTKQTAGVGTGHMAANLNTNSSFERSGNHVFFKTSTSSVLLIAIKKGFPPVSQARSVRAHQVFTTLFCGNVTMRRNGGCNPIARYR
jgi:hypothetical protein